MAESLLILIVVVNIQLGIKFQMLTGNVPADKQARTETSELTLQHIQVPVFMALSLFW